MPEQHVALPPDGFSSPQAVREFTGLSRSTVYRWMAAGRFPRPIKFSSRVLRWRNADLHAWAANPAGWRAANQSAHHG